jgi:NTP pyrophosphatase (non-canonical NTP hydrolase)
MEIEQLKKELYKEYVENGYRKMWNSAKTVPQQKRNDIAELGLIVTEVSEAMEEVREQNTVRSKLGIECADIIIRTINFMSRKNIDVVQSLLDAMQKNEKRGRLHGRAV